MWTYMGKSLNPDDLLRMADLIQRLRADGATNNALSHIRNEQFEHFGMELIWQYQITEGESAGGFILPVQEGILWIPYDEVTREDGELLLLSDAHLLSEDACRILYEEYESYAEGLCSMLREAEQISRDLGNVSADD